MCNVFRPLQDALPTGGMLGNALASENPMLGTSGYDLFMETTSPSISDNGLAAIGALDAENGIYRLFGGSDGDTDSRTNVLNTAGQMWTVGQMLGLGGEEAVAGDTVATGGTTPAGGTATTTGGGYSGLTDAAIDAGLNGGSNTVAGNAALTNAGVTTGLGGGAVGGGATASDLAIMGLGTGGGGAGAGVTSGATTGGNTFTDWFSQGSLGDYAGLVQPIAGLITNGGGMADAGQAGANAADPFAPYRPGFGLQMMNLANNPSSVSSMPGFAAGSEAVQRSMGAQGYQGSGNMATALMDYGQRFYGDELMRLANLAGANVSNPGIAAQIGYQGQSDATSINANSILTLMTALGNWGNNG